LIKDRREKDFNPDSAFSLLLLSLGVLERSLIQNILGGQLDKFNRLPNPGSNKKEG